MCFPNDPTHTLLAHQMFVGVENAKKIELYSVSSIFGKEKRVYGSDTDNYFKIIGDDQINNGFKTPSFIDCAKSYCINDPMENYSKLSGRSLNDDLKRRVLENINECKKKGVHISYSLNESDIKKWNPKL